MLASAARCAQCYILLGVCRFCILRSGQHKQYLATIPIHDGFAAALYLPGLNAEVSRELR